jgi:teichuronic acid biosynthesis glycosyltransferase TuaH
VVTDTAAMKMFEPYVFLCTGKEEYVLKIKYITDHPQEVNTTDIQQQRKNFALSHTWENSIGLMGDAFFTVTQNLQHG